MKEKTRFFKEPTRPYEIWGMVFWSPELMNLHDGIVEASLDEEDDLRAYLIMQFDKLEAVEKAKFENKLKELK